MKIGYLRVSTEDQKPDRQIDGLTSLCDELRTEKISAASKNRPVFDQLLDELKKGDTLVVWDLDRAFRSTVDAIVQAEQLRERGVEFQIMTLGVDTSTADGKLIYTIIAALAEHERSRLSERTKQGLQAARKRGRRLGRPRKLSRQQLQCAIQALTSKKLTISELAIRNGVHPSTLARNIRQLEEIP